MRWTITARSPDTDAEHPLDPHSQKKTGRAGKGEAIANPLQKPEEARTPYERMEVATKKVVEGDEGKAWHVSTEGGSKHKK